MPTLSIDIETYSSVNLIQSGVYKYVESPDFEILLFAYKLDNDPVDIVDFSKGEKLSFYLYQCLTLNDVLKTAYNANFEITCLRKYFKMDLPASQWECTMVRAGMLGLPMKLENVAKALKLKQEKMSAGKNLVKYFTMPCKPTKVNGGRTRNHPHHDPEKWSLFKEYNRQDVIVEEAIRERISFFQIPKQEKRLWTLDQRINDRGMLLDQKFVTSAIEMDRGYRKRLLSESIALTGLDNPNSVAQLKGWMETELSVPIKSLNKEMVPQLLDLAAPNSKAERMLEIRQETSKTSIKKYIRMLLGICSDKRVRGLLQFYGANRTGRWAGRLIQVHNLPKNEMDDLDLARNLVREGNAEMVELLFGSIPDVLSQLIRTAFVAAPGSRLLISDFSAIEARIIAWLAGERWRMDVFRTHGKIYEASASAMFKVPIEQITKASPLRFKGKVSELALGYQGGVGALIQMGALKMGLSEEELPGLVKKWRAANKKIVQLWYKVGDAAVEAIQTGKPTEIQFGIRFLVERGVFYIELPSKRRLAYIKPGLRENRFGGMVITYQGMDQTIKQWKTQETYGGKLVENIVQAIARDCLATAMMRLSDAGYNINMHIHDEIVMEEPKGKGSIDEVNRIMSLPIDWAKGLPLKADSHESFYYKKD